MSDYIKREDALAVIYGQHIGGKEACENARPNTFGADLREIVCEIEDIPAADVREVVLCRDCKYYNTTGCADGYGWCEDSVVSTGVWDNFFCGRADMRGEADET